MAGLALEHPAPGGVAHIIVVSPDGDTAKLVQNPVLGLRLVYEVDSYFSLNLNTDWRFDKGSAEWHMFHGLRALAARILAQKHAWQRTAIINEFRAVQRDPDGSQLFNLLVAARAPLEKAMRPPVVPFDLDKLLDDAEHLETKARVYKVASSAAKDARRIADRAWDHAALNEELESHKWRYLAPGPTINHGRAGKRRATFGRRTIKVIEPTATKPWLT